MMQFTREGLLADLRMHTCRIRFTKVNGEKRIMDCTLLPHLLPEGTNRQKLEEEHEKHKDTGSLAVWDLQNNGWRSFRIDSVEYAEIIDGY